MKQTITVTPQIIQGLTSGNGGHTSIVKELLTGSKKPKKGWTRKCLGNKIDRAQYMHILENKLHMGKQKRERANRPELFGPKPPRKPKGNAYYPCLYRGYTYLVGCLEGEWWICETVKTKDGPVIHMEYEWGSSMDEVLDLKGLDQSNVL